MLPAFSTQDAGKPGRAVARTPTESSRSRPQGGHGEARRTAGLPRPTSTRACATEAVAFRDILFCSTGSPRLSGIRNAGRTIMLHLRRAVPATRILVVATRSGVERIGQVLRSGASGPTWKEAESANLVRQSTRCQRRILRPSKRTTARAWSFSCTPPRRHDQEGVGDRGPAFRRDGASRGGSPN